ncbi:MAG: hypothetical protein FJY67_06420 [Calditrichaeota bacterium]|nr:hypothetical protein [Calditrichota bacterium]
MRPALPVIAIAAALTALVGCKRDSEVGALWEVRYSTSFGRLARWSPNGIKLLFGDDRPGEIGLWTWQPGSDPVLILAEQPHNWDYAWSPDSREIVWTVPDGEGDSLGGIWIFRIDSAEKRRVHSTGRDAGWLADGSALVARLDRPIAGTAGIYLIPLDDGAPQLLVDDGIRPAASPRSHVIAFGSRELNGILQLLTLAGLTPSGIETLSTSGAMEWMWSARGGHLFYIINSFTSGQMRGTLWSAQLPGIVRDSLTIWAAQPAPNASGTEVAFVRQSGGRWAGIWLLTGEHEERITEYGVNPAFDPSGDQIAYDVAGGGLRIAVRTR